MPKDPFAAIAESSASNTDPFASIAETDNPPIRPTATIGPAPSGVKEWLYALGRDVEQGGSRTAPGRILGILQGRGSKGYSGTESGTSKGASDFVASFPLGGIKVAQGIAETPEHPVRGVLKELGGVAQIATIPSLFAGGPAMSKAIEAIPNAKWAGKMLESVAGDAGQVPVNLSRSGDEILRVKELADRGASMPQAVGKMLNRITRPRSKPIDYSEARDFYSNITRLSADEMGRLNQIMRRQIGIVANALKHDIGDAAGEVNRAADYYAAINDYAKSFQLKRAAIQIGKQVGIPLAKLAAAGAAAKAGWDVLAKGAGH